MMYLNAYDTYITFCTIGMLSLYAFVVFAILSKVISGKLNNWESYPLIPNIVQRMVHDLWFNVLKENKFDAQLMMWFTPIVIIVLSSVWVVTVPLLCYGIYKYTYYYACSSSNE